MEAVRGSREEAGSERAPSTAPSWAETGQRRIECQFPPSDDPSCRRPRASPGGRTLSRAPGLKGGRRVAACTGHLPRQGRGVFLPRGPARLKGKTNEGSGPVRPSLRRSFASVRRRAARESTDEPQEGPCSTRGVSTPERRGEGPQPSPSPPPLGVGPVPETPWARGQADVDPGIEDRPAPIALRVVRGPCGHEETCRVAPLHLWSLRPSPAGSPLRPRCAFPSGSQDVSGSSPGARTSRLPDADPTRGKVGTSGAPPTAPLEGDPEARRPAVEGALRLPPPPGPGREGEGSAGPGGRRD